MEAGHGWAGTCTGQGSNPAVQAHCLTEHLLVAIRGTDRASTAATTALCSPAPLLLCKIEAVVLHLRDIWAALLGCSGSQPCCLGLSRIRWQNSQPGQNASRLPSTTACLQVGWPGPAPARQTADRQHRPGLQREQAPAHLQGRQRCAEQHLQRRAPPSGTRQHLVGGSRRCPPGRSLR